MREHEMKWAESTANEMSLRVEVCALKDERATALGDAAALKKRCEALRRENNELGERCVTSFLKAYLTLHSLSRYLGSRGKTFRDLTRNFDA